jgi:hypothetical protein
VPSNRRLQLTAFGARDRAFFESWILLDCFPDLWRRQLKRESLGAGINAGSNLERLIVVH